MSQCTATSKRTHERCQRPSIRGRTTCYHHGGHSPQGIASATIKEGRYSRHIPTRMMATYQESRADPELLALRDDVSLIDGRIIDLLKRVDTGESGATWRAVKQAFTDLIDANAAKDAEKANAAYRQLQTLINRGTADELAWQDIRATLEQRRKLVESERKRLIDMHQMVTGDQAMLMIGALTQAVRDHVTDPDILRAISADLGRVTFAGPSGQNRAEAAD